MASVRRPAQQRALAAALAAALGMHGWLLGLWPAPWPTQPVSEQGNRRHAAEAPLGRAAAPAFTVRQIVATPPGHEGVSPTPVIAAGAAATTGSAEAAPAARAGGVAAAAARREASPPVRPPPPALATWPPSRPPGPAAPADTAALAAAGQAQAESPAPAAAPAWRGAEAGAPLPTYSTVLPPSATLMYEVRRGTSAGAAALHWQLDDAGRYRLELQGDAGGVAGPGGEGDPAAARERGAARSPLAPHWTSRGTLDTAGIAPERFAVARRGRERHAANFRRDAGLVSFAGPSRTWPLVNGVQDRLSWMVQLAAILEGNPALARPGTQISMMVVGAHGDAGVWTFVVQGRADVPGPAGEPVATWHLARASAQAYDPDVEVWVAPALHHLPVRLRLALPQRGESTEFTLRALQPP